MLKKQIFSKYGLIGENLDLKKNVSLEIDEEGKIINIYCENPENIIDISEKGPIYLIMPGLINSHVHVVDNFAKEKGFNKGLIEIVAPPNGLKHKLLASTSEAVKINGVKKAILEMLSSGITCFIDFREGGIEGINLLKKTIKDSPLNNLILGRYLNAEDVESVFNLADGIGLASYNSISRDVKRRLSKCKSESKKLIACHCAEYERDQNLIEEMISDHLVDVAVHGTQLIKDDLEQMEKNNISLVLCPRCNGYFGVGFPPISDILRLKIPVSLGTDNLMASNVDLFEEMRYLYRVMRVLRKNDKSANLTAKDLLKMITINAARIFNLEGDIGSISEGKNADFFLVDLSDPNFFVDNMDQETIYPVIVQRTKSENIKQTYIKGECVFERKC